MPPSGTLPLTVFIADDSAPVADMLTEVLTALGRVNVVGVGDSEAGAIDAISRIKPDAVVLDLQLGTGSGTNVIRAVRADPSLAGIRVFVMSNHASAPLKAGCLELGANDYFDKVKELPRLTRSIAELAQEKEDGNL